MRDARHTAPAMKHVEYYKYGLSTFRKRIITIFYIFSSCCAKAESRKGGDEEVKATGGGILPSTVRSTCKLTTK